jgi:tetratricopeptide (TPR) repeat protein
MSEFVSDHVPSSSSSSNPVGGQDAEELKKLANDLFIANKFAEAEVLYNQALSLTDKDDLKVLLHTNCAAALIGMHKYEEALFHANAAIALDPTWVKAYYRKSSALESLNRFREMYDTWIDAGKVCENNQALIKQFKAAQQKWSKQFRKADYPIVSSEDLLRRFDLFTDKRERLSTLAHFWNDSAQEERLSYFIMLIQIIGGQGALSAQNQELFSPDIMVPLPLNNYHDLPRSRLQNWFDFFQALPSDEKNIVFRSVWDHLSSEEKNDVIVDMRQFLAAALHSHGEEDVIDP